ncbi:d-beta-hydroxybutyrate dehydrogenase [Trichonephila clavipes]|nr:d-beta-hydroxybutyrate dehydrogenase [Trichonephila clavipes]
MPQCPIVSHRALAPEEVRQNKFGKQIKSTNKAVLITGCDTGFGFSIAKRLSRKGFQVFAGCLSPFKNGGLELKTVRNVHCLQMDVSREQDINFVSNYIERNLGENSNCNFMIS